MIAKRYSMGGGNWDKMHKMCTYNYNTSVHTVTKMTPFLMQNRREARVPVALALGITEWEPDTTPRTYT